MAGGLAQSLRFACSGHVPLSLCSCKIGEWVLDLITEHSGSVLGVSLEFGSWSS